MKKYVSRISFLLIVSCSFAAGPVNLEDSGIVATGLEIEYGYTGSTVGNDTTRESGFTLTSAAWPGGHIGISKSFFHTPYHVAGTGDTELSVKQALAENTALALSGTMRDGDDKNGFGSSFHEYTATVAQDFSFGKTTLFSNLAYTTYDKRILVSDGDDDDDETQNNWGIGLGLGYDLTEHWGVCAEVTKQIVHDNYLQDVDGQVIGTLGIEYNLENYSFDLSYTSIPEEKDYVFSLGTTVSL